MALWHTLGPLPEPESTDDFCPASDGIFFFQSRGKRIGITTIRSGGIIAPQATSRTPGEPLAG